MSSNDAVVDLLQQLVKWSREAALPAVKTRVGGLLDTDSKLRVYHAIRDGSVTVRKLEDIGAGVSRQTAQALVTEWEAAGLVEPGSNPPQALFTLAELGIALPDPKPARKRSPKP